MFGLPSLQIIMTVAVAPVLIAFAIVNYKENIYSVATWFVVCITDILVLSGYFPFMYNAWNSDGDINNPQPKKSEKQYLNLNDTSSVYSQETISLKIDCVRLFNRTLIDQRNGNLPVNMTENFWIKKADGQDLNNWQKIGGIGKADWEDMIRRMIAFGACKEIGGQGKRVPDDWSKIRKLERGHPLP